MERWHIKPNGEPGLCSAEIRGCPYGGPEAHYTSKEAAQKSFEDKMGGGLTSVKVLPSDTFVSLLNSRGEDAGSYFGKELKNTLEENSYSAYFYDPEREDDVYIILDKDENGRLTYTETDSSIPHDFIYRPPSEESKKKLKKLENDLAELENHTSPQECQAQGWNRLTLMDNIRAFQGLLARSPLYEATDYVKLKNQLSDSYYDLDNEIIQASLEDEPEEERTLTLFKNILQPLIQ